MCADLLKKNDIGLLADVDDVKGLVAGSSKLLQDTSLRRAMAEQALLVTKDYDWSVIVERYNQEVYMPLLSH
jgi:glycosyltransferase involved in cell wall biosynthesis